jgi:hypothetical protein
VSRHPGFESIFDQRLKLRGNKPIQFSGIEFRTIEELTRDTTYGVSGPSSAYSRQLGSPLPFGGHRTRTNGSSSVSLGIQQQKLCKAVSGMTNIVFIQRFHSPGCCGLPLPILTQETICCHSGNLPTWPQCGQVINLIPGGQEACSCAQYAC